MSTRALNGKAVRTLIAAAVVTGLAACGGGGTGDSAAGKVVTGSWDQVVAAAKSEGSVSWYTVAPDVQNDRLIKAFNQKYPDIQVRKTRGAGELPARVETEIGSKSEGADVFLYSDPAWFGKHGDAFLKVDGPSVTGWHTDAWAVKDKAIVPSAYPWSMFVWNTNTFPKGFNSWDQLVEPAVKDKLGLRSEVTTSLAGFLAWKEEKLGADYLVKQAAQSPKFYPSVVPMVQAVASGEIGVTDTGTPSTVKGLKDQGAPIDSIIPKPSYWIQWGAAALTKSQRPNASRVLLDFIMSAEGQTALNGDGYGAASRDGIAGAITPVDATVLDSTKFTKERVAEYNQKFTKWFG